MVITLESCQENEIDVLEAKRAKAKYEYDSTLNEHNRLLGVRDSLLNIGDSLERQLHSLDSSLKETIKKYNK